MGLAPSSVMQSKIVTMWVPRGADRAALLVRRGDGRLALQGIDARVARAARLAADFLRAHPASSLGGQLAQDEGVFGRDLSVALESA
jgi:hypothetical protein